MHRHEVRSITSLDESSASNSRDTMNAACSLLPFLVLLNGFGIAIFTTLLELQSLLLHVFDATAGYVLWILCSSMPALQLMALLVFSLNISHLA